MPTSEGSTAARLEESADISAVIAAGASGDLAYIVAFEHTAAAVNGAPPQPYMLRVTTVFRREDGTWRIVHRHGDSLALRAAAGIAKRLSASDH